MHADLAICLGQFIDDQVKLIDDRLERIKQEQIAACNKNEHEKNLYNKNKPIPKNKGTHYENKALIDQFIQDLCDDDANVSKPKSIIDDPNCVDTLHAEVSTKINACSNYITRIRNLAQPLPRTSKFVELCNEAIDYFRRTQEFEDNLKKLYTVLEQNKLNHRNQKINSAVTENNFAILSSTSRVIDDVKKLMAARKVVSVEPQKLDIIRKFVKRLLTR
ncbi:unnamed protein product [Rotaria sordida]|uniref:Uncharacterized protein n=1 Tax=Rotaria sordida TaxID=392033 RepID=A0A814DZI7_9BILA|nr:unnamed protein product [Rotaria sordida]CAF4136373.1 unnamed protein product [Rotaria sordida]